jgi:tRNA G37 N-methylase Trm5
MKVNRFLNLKVAGRGSPSLRHNTFFWKVPLPKVTFSARLKTEKKE